VRRDENYGRTILAGKGLEHLETLMLGHPHVQEHQSGPESEEGGDRVDTALALSNEVDVRVRAKKRSETLPRQRLIVGHHGPDHATLSSATEIGAV